MAFGSPGLKQVGAAQGAVSPNAPTPYQASAGHKKQILDEVRAFLVEEGCDKEKVASTSDDSIEKTIGRAWATDDVNDKCWGAALADTFKSPPTPALTRATSESAKLDLGESEFYLPPLKDWGVEAQSLFDRTRMDMSKCHKLHLQAHAARSEGDLIQCDFDTHEPLGHMQKILKKLEWLSSYANAALAKIAAGKPHPNNPDYVHAKVHADLTAKYLARMQDRVRACEEMLKELDGMWRQHKASP